jgi:predicted phosphodiesterase
MMESEGFNDSATIESYRCLVKNYQKTSDQLPSIVSAKEEKEAEISDEMDSIRKFVGDIAWEKRENQNVLREIGKLKRFIIDRNSFFKDLKECFKEIIDNIGVPYYPYTPVSDPRKDRKSRIIATPADWHVGGLVDLSTNEYNYAQAEKRVDEYVDRLGYAAARNNVSNIDVVFLGDAIEHSYMRPSQSYDVEFPLSYQIPKFVSLMLRFLTKLSKFVNVSYAGFSGNHDRIEGDKNLVVDGDDSMVIANEFIKQLLDSHPSIRYVQADKYGHAITDVYGRNFKFRHGDKDKKADQKKLSYYSHEDNVHYDVIAFGHLHHIETIEISNDGYELWVGSLKGEDNYSKKIGRGSSPSQSYIVVHDDGEMEFNKITLK